MAAIVATHAAVGPASGQAAEESARTLLGVSVGIGAYGGESDNSELLDIAPVFGLMASHRLASTLPLGIRVDATLSPLGNASADEVYDARTHLVALTAGPMLAPELGGFTPYLAVVGGVVAAVSRGTTVRAAGPYGPREVDETTFAPAWGLAAGARLVLEASDHPWGVDVGARVIDMSTLTFVRPHTDTFERDSDLLELRFGVTLGL